MAAPRYHRAVLPALLTAITATATGTASLTARLELEVHVLDYELPRHPNTDGRGNLGVLLRPLLVHRPSPRIVLEAGALVRVPFSLDFEEELGALPHFAAVLEPFDGVRLTLGSLRIDHGWHPALFDEDRQRFARDLEAAYNLTIVPAARRDLEGGDPFMPAEHGASLVVAAGPLSSEVYLDWQLLETREHREKFAVGWLAALDLDRFQLDAQLRVVHYGGQQLTRSDPIRAAGLDPKRQPVSLGLSGSVRPLEMQDISIDLTGGIFAGYMIQSPGGDPRWHTGLELGADAILFDAATLGYRFWRPRGEDPGFLSEDGDPIYRGGRSHRVSIGLAQVIDQARLEGRLDVVFPDGVEAVQYLAVTELSLPLEVLLWQAEE